MLLKIARAVGGAIAAIMIAILVGVVAAPASTAALTARESSTTEDSNLPTALTPAGAPVILPGTIPMVRIGSGPSREVMRQPAGSPGRYLGLCHPCWCLAAGRDRSRIVVAPLS